MRRCGPAAAVGVGRRLLVFAARGAAVAAAAASGVHTFPSSTSILPGSQSSVVRCAVRLWRSSFVSRCPGRDRHTYTFDADVCRLRARVSLPYESVSARRSERRRYQNRKREGQIRSVRQETRVLFRRSAKTRIRERKTRTSIRRISIYANDYFTVEIYGGDTFDRLFKVWIARSRNC